MMQKSLQAHARVYALILSNLFASQKLAGRLATATRGARYLTLGVRLANHNTIDKALKLAEPLALASKVETVISTRQTGLICYQYQLQSHFWQTYTRADVTGLTVGLAEQRRPVRFSFEDAPHALFGGTSGSGKTEAIKSTLLALMGAYSPLQMAFVIIDTDNVLEDFHNAAHLEMPLATELNEADNALSYVYAELKNRKANNIKDGKPLVLVIDEVSDLTGQPGNVEMLKAIAKQGRKYHLHLIAGNQKPSTKELPNILDNLLNRFVGQVDNAQTSVLLTGHSGLHAHKLTGKGDFLHITAGGNVDRFQVALATQSDYERLERREITPVQSFQAPPIVDLSPANPGRPKTRLEPAYLAYYIHQGRHLSIAQANERLGFSKRKHNYYKQFTAEFLAELKHLRGIA